MGFISWVIVGLIVGALARLVVPGSDRMGCIGTILLGVGGSLTGGTIASIIAGQGFDIAPSGFIGSVLGSVILLLALRRFRK